MGVPFYLKIIQIWLSNLENNFDRNKVLNENNETAFSKKEFWRTNCRTKEIILILCNKLDGSVDPCLLLSKAIEKKEPRGFYGINLEK